MLAVGVQKLDGELGLALVVERQELVLGRRGSRQTTRYAVEPSLRCLDSRLATGTSLRPWENSASHGDRDLIHRP
jgi:hypothetical protein